MEGAEKFFFFPDDRIRRGQLLFQSQAGLRLGEAEDALAVQQFDEVELNFIAVNHKLIVREIRKITTSQNDFGSRAETATAKTRERILFLKPFAYFASFAVPSESARGLAQSTTLCVIRESQANASRHGLRWPSTALPLTMSLRWSFGLFG